MGYGSRGAGYDIQLALGMSFSGFSKPITKEQFGKLAKPQPSKP